MLANQCFLWISELIFSCTTSVSKNCFTSVSMESTSFCHLNRYSSPGPLDYIPQFLCISWFFLRNSVFDVTPLLYQGLMLIWLVWNQDAAAYRCVWASYLFQTPTSFFWIDKYSFFFTFCKINSSSSIHPSIFHPSITMIWWSLSQLSFGERQAFTLDKQTTMHTHNQQ